MRKLAFVLVILGSVLPVLASKGISVAELEQRLISAGGKSDAEVAQQLSDFELTERLSSTTLARLESNAPGTRTSQELKILADQSAFLSLPATEIPAIPTPDLAAQRQIMGLVVNYVSNTIHQLPNFYATRVTTHFEEMPQIQTPMHSIAYRPLHQTDAHRVTVLYRDGQEVVDTERVRSKASKQQGSGLNSWGIFGPILGTVFLDAAKSDLSWSHWEQVPNGKRAVFRYAVPLKNSHFRTNYCCVPGPNPSTDPLTPFDRFVGYRGEIAVDPQQGSILRLTIQADLKPSDPISRADIMVEYGSVEIGGRTYICATRSVALSSALWQGNVDGQFGYAGDPQQKLLNDVAFEQYHMFRAQARILTGDEPTLPQEPSTDASASPTSSDTANALPAPQPTGMTEPQSAPPAADSANAAAQNTSVQDHPAEQASAAAPTPAPTTVPTPTAADHAPVFKTATHEVLVEVVATKGKDEPILGLGKQDFEIKENGKPQTIDFFEAHTTADVAPSATPEMPVMPAGARTNVQPAPLGDAVNLLLIDTLNTDMQDQAYLRSQVMAFSAKMQPGIRMAIFVLGAKLTCLQGFTSDSSVLLAALKAQPDASKTQKSSLRQTSSDRAGDADAMAMLLTMQASPAAIQGFQSALAGAVGVSAGARASMTFQALMYLGHYLSGVPGRKNLIWFSGSFPIVIFPTAAQFDRIKQNSSQHGYLDRVRATANLFTASQIAVYPISAEGMMVEHIGEAESAGPGGSMGPGHVGSGAGSTMTPYHEGSEARASAIFGMEQLAASTGGKAYFNTNDLETALHHAVDDGANYYTIGYSPVERKADGSYRQIEIRLTHGKSKLAYRQGYIADNGPAPTSQSSIDPLEPLLLLGLPGAAGILYGVHAEQAEVQPSFSEARAGQNPGLKGPVTRYTVDFVVRGQDLVLNPTPQGTRSGKFLLGLRAYDHGGNALNWAADEETVDIEPDQFDSVQKNGIPVHLNIDLPAAGDIHLVTAVYDLNSGMAGTLEIPLQINPR